MAHTINYQFIHLLWSTKDQQPLINEANATSLLTYLGGVFRGLGGQLIGCSATANHIHLLVNVPTEISISDLLRRAKSSSSKWHRENSSTNSNFGWNEGYSAFSVSPHALDMIKKYLSGEPQRHKQQTYESELTDFLNFHEIEYHPNFFTKSSHTKLINHLVWSVKNRESLLDKDIQHSLHQQIRQEVLNSGGMVLGVGNFNDHIHILMECSKNVAMAHLVQQIKTKTTHMIKGLDKKYARFHWQDGFGIFSVGKPAYESVLNYVNNQEDHHRVKSFDQEWEWLKLMKTKM